MTTPAPSDPRVYFAAERTMLAWLRTGIAVMAFGFVVARFGLFLRLLRLQGGEPVPGHGLSPYLGAALVLLGVVALGVGATSYRRFCRHLSRSDLPTPQAPTAPLALAGALIVAGLLLTWALLN